MPDYNNNKSRRNKPSVGGKAIASGGFGCVFKPALRCKRKSGKHGNQITKLMKRKYAKEEYREITTFRSLLQDIPNYSDYFLLDGFSLCEPEKLDEEDLHGFDKKCKPLKKIDITVSNVNSSLDQLLSLNMPYGGVDVEKYIAQVQMDYKKIHTLNNALILLLQNGILPMNKRGVFHCDIKDNNVLIQEDEKTGRVKARLIDWGLSASFHPNTKTIPKHLLNRPFQFNVPFSVVLFNDMFTRMYKEFLKEHKGVEPGFFLVRSFVINYVIAWVHKRGVGHIKSLNSMFTGLFERGLVNIEETFKADLIEFDYTFYFMFEYISYVVFKFTREGEFQRMEYFTEVFLKNNDLWGFIMTYLPIVEILEKHYKKLSVPEKQIIEVIRTMILYAVECSYVPMDPEKIIGYANELQELFLKASRQSTVHFENVTSSSSSIKKSSIKKSSTKKRSTSMQKKKTLRYTM